MSAETPALKLPTSLTVYLLVYLILVIAYTPQSNSYKPQAAGKGRPKQGEDYEEAEVPHNKGEDEFKDLNLESLNPSRVHPSTSYKRTHFERETCNSKEAIPSQLRKPQPNNCMQKHSFAELFCQDASEEQGREVSSHAHRGCG